MPFRIPEDLRLVRMNIETGRLARPVDRKAILEAFKPGTVPRGEQAVIDGGYNPLSGEDPGGTGGLY